MANYYDGQSILINYQSGNNYAILVEQRVMTGLEYWLAIYTQ